MQKLKSKMILFKGENKFARQILTVICLTLIIQFFILPISIIFDTDTLYIFFLILGMFSYNFDTHSFQHIFEPFILFLALPLIVTLILLIFLITKLNILKRETILILGVTSATLLMISILMGIFVYFIFLNYQGFPVMYLAILIVAMILAMTFSVLRKANGIQADAKENESLNRSEIQDSKSHIKMIFVIISVILIIQLFGPSFIGFYISITTKVVFYPFIDIYFFLGIFFQYNYLDGTLHIEYDPYSLLQTIPLTVGLILLIMLVIKLKTLRRTSKLALGIICSTLLILSPILYYIVYAFIIDASNYFSFRLLNIHFIILCAILIIFGTKIISSKANNSNETIFNKESKIIQ
ncbi:MAG: hypothetical protein ACFFAS_02025 [Promethearchaeota archaeon]